MFAEGIDEIGDEVFVLGAAFEDVLFVLDDNFVIGDFDDLFPGDGELRIKQTLNGGATDDNLLDEEIIRSDSEINDLTELGAFLGLDFQSDKAEIESEDFLNLDDVILADEFIDVVDNHAEVGILADGRSVEKVAMLVDGVAFETEGDNFEIIGVDDSISNTANGTT